MKFSLHLLLILSLVLTFSCKKEIPGGNEKLPDLVVKLDAKKGGTAFDSIDFALVEQKGSTGESAGGSHQKLTNLFVLQVSPDLSKVGPRFGVNTSLTSISTTTIDMANPPSGMIPTTMTYTSSDSKSYQANSGTLKIVKADLYQDIGVGAADYFVDFEVNLTLVNVNDASDVITLEGDLLGVNIKQQ
ncbi:MAG: hypothetical protein KDE26_13130 [Bacteroidetes bacterium]|nr:hypothetical protein [Bacteroidota bacterium]MCB0844190.1 hypothetical protein [Bacteroidota bacterium]